MTFKSAYTTDHSDDPRANDAVVDAMRTGIGQYKAVLDKLAQIVENGRQALTGMAENLARREGRDDEATSTLTANHDQYEGLMDHLDDLVTAGRESVATAEEELAERDFRV